MLGKCRRPLRKHLTGTHHCVCLALTELKQGLFTLPVSLSAQELELPVLCRLLAMRTKDALYGAQLTWGDVGSITGARLAGERQWATSIYVLMCRHGNVGGLDVGL